MFAIPRASGYDDNMKNHLPLLVLICIVVLLGVLWITAMTQESSSGNVSTTITNTSTSPVVSLEKGANGSDVFLVRADGTTTFFHSIPDINVDHYHWGEYNNGNVFVIRRLGYSEPQDAEWTDELWRYDQGKNGEKIYSVKGLDFRISPDGATAAVQVNESVIFVTIADGTTETLARDQMSLGGKAAGLRLEEWSTDSAFLWGSTLHTATRTFFRIERSSKRVERFGMPFVLAVDYDLNVDANMLAYSDYPRFLDMESLTEFEQSKKQVTLWVYDLSTQRSEVIASREVKEFQPEWKNATTVSYNAETSGRTEAVLSASLQTVVPTAPAGGDRFTFTPPEDWQMNRNYYEYNTLAGGGPMKVVEVAPDTSGIGFDEPSVSFSWYRFNPNASLADIGDALQYTAGSRPTKTDTSLAGIAARKIVERGTSAGTEPYYLNEKYLLRLDAETVLHVNVFYPSQNVFETYRTSVDGVLGSLKLL